MLGRTEQRRVDSVLKENSVKKLVYLCVKSVSSDSMAWHVVLLAASCAQRACMERKEVEQIWAKLASHAQLDTRRLNQEAKDA